MDYTVDLLKVCGVAILCSVCLVILGRFAGGMGFAVRIGGSVLIFGALLMMVSENTAIMREMTSFLGGTDGLASQAFSLMLKALGIALVSKFCSDICRDCGEGSLAGGVESVGRIAIISLCIPVVAEILGYASAILDSGA